MRIFKSPRPMLGATALALAALAVGPAQASLSSATVTLSAPGGIIGDSTAISAADTLSAGDGVKIIPGDGSNIGGTWMLPLEQISFSGNSILVTIASGGQLGNGDLVTGYLGLGSNHALYDFSGLGITGQTINGLSASVTAGGLILGGGSIYDYVHYLSPQEFTIDLDSLVFQPPAPGAGESTAFATLRINMLSATTPPNDVPEPAGTALLAIGGLALTWTQRRRSHKAAADKAGK